MAERIQVLPDLVATRKYTRRGLMLRASVIGVSAPLIGTLLSACGGSSSSVTSAPTASNAPGATPAQSSGGGQAPVATAGASPSSGAPLRGGTATIGLAASVIGLDPHLSSGTEAAQVMELVYDTLISYDKSFAFVPNLATKWEVASDGLGITFTLTQGIKFHDGTPFNAQAVKANIDRVLDKTLGARLTTQLTQVSEVQVVDDNTARFVLSQPLAPLLSLLTDHAGTIISPKAIQEEGKDLARKPVGTGAFTFAEWLKDDHLTIERNKQYWKQGIPYLDQVTYKPITDSTVRLTALKTDEVQMIASIALKDVAEVKGDSSLVYDELPSFAFSYIALNCAVEPFNNMALRQAIAWSIDREAIRKSLYFGTGAVANSPIPPSSWAYDPSLVVYGKQDYDMAKKKLTEGGKPNGFEFEMLVYNNPDDMQTATAYRDQLREVNISAKLLTLEKQTLLDRAYAGNFQAQTGTWSGGPDPDDEVYSYFYSQAGANRTKYHNADVDKLMEEGRKASDREKRKTAYNQLAKIIVDEAPFVFVIHPAEIKVWRPVLQGFIHTADGVMRLNSVWRSDAD